MPLAATYVLAKSSALVSIRFLKKYGGCGGECVTWSARKYRIIVAVARYNQCILFQLAKALKDLPNRVQTASKKERREILQNVVNVLSNPGKNRGKTRTIC